MHFVLLNLCISSDVDENWLDFDLGKFPLRVVMADGQRRHHQKDYAGLEGKLVRVSHDLQARVMLQWDREPQTVDVAVRHILPKHPASASPSGGNIVVVGLTGTNKGRIFTVASMDGDTVSVIERVKGGKGKQSKRKKEVLKLSKYDLVLSNELRK